MTEDEAIQILVKRTEEFVNEALLSGYAEFGPFTEDDLKEEKEALRILKGGKQNDRI